MSVTPTTFRQHYPEFASTGSYPDSAVEFQLGLAELLFNKRRWGRMLDTGQELFIAHNLAIERKAQNEAAVPGGVPGLSSGPVSSKSVDKVSISYDTNAGIDPKASHWNLTIYGTRLYRLFRLVGMGPVQVGGSSSHAIGAWPGVIYPPNE